jgi:hypothetical protein
MKSGQGQTPLATMKVALAGQESFAEQPFCALKSTPFHKTLVMRDEHVLDVIRVIEKENLLRAETKIDYVAMLAGGLL